MSAHVDLDDLIDALAWVSAGEASSLDAQAYVGRANGKVYWVGEGVDEDPPEDCDDEDACIAVPTRRDLDLDQHLARRYVEEHLPRSLDKIEGFFHKRGAYAKFKSHLDSVGHLEKWFAYEEAAIAEGLTRWAELNGFSVTRKAAGK